MERNGMAINKEKENLDCVMIFCLISQTPPTERERKKIFITHFSWVVYTILFFFLCGLH